MSEEGLYDGDAMAGNGLTLRSVSLVDATIIDAPASSKNKSGKRAPAMSSTRKGNDWYFGMKAHAEHPFRVLKRQFGGTKTRYRGLAGNRAQLFSLFAPGNLHLAPRRPMD